jgi:hypothetical protein
VSGEHNIWEIPNSLYTRIKDCSNNLCIICVGMRMMCFVNQADHLLDDRVTEEAWTLLC